MCVDVKSELSWQAAATCWRSSAPCLDMLLCASEVPSSPKVAPGFGSLERSWGQEDSHGRNKNKLQTAITPLKYGNNTEGSLRYVEICVICLFPGLWVAEAAMMREALLWAVSACGPQASQHPCLSLEQGIHPGAVSSAAKSSTAKVLQTPNPLRHVQECAGKEGS